MMAVVGCASVLSGLADSPVLQVEARRTQTIELREGWNAVHLQVHPEQLAPAELFAGTPVDVVAGYLAPARGAQFVSDPSADLFREVGWAVWYAPDRPDAFLSTLHSIHGQQPYLIHARSAYTWQVEGVVLPAVVRWRPDSFNLVGFSLDAVAPPTFGQFFSGSRAHQHDRIYRLIGDSWQRVTEASATTMQDGEAFWIYCEGPSRFQGPLRVETQTRYGVVLSESTSSVILRNTSDQPISLRVEHIPVSDPGVPLSVVVRVVGDPKAPVRQVAAPKPVGSWTQALPPLEPGRSVRLPLEARTEEMQSSVQSSLLRISTDLGTVSWLPVTAVRPDLQDN